MEAIDLTVLKDAPQSVEAIDLSVLKDAPPGKWIALSRGKTRIVGTGDSMQEAVAKANANGESNPLVLMMPECLCRL